MELPLDLKMMMDERNSEEVNHADNTAEALQGESSKMLPGQILSASQLQMVANSQGMNATRGYSSTNEVSTLHHSHRLHSELQQHGNSTTSISSIPSSNSIPANLISSLPLLTSQQIATSGIAMSTVNSTAHLRSPPSYSSVSCSSADAGGYSDTMCASNNGDNSRNIQDMLNYTSDSTGTFTTTTTTIHQCLECSIGFISRRAYEAHMASHSNKPASQGNVGREDNMPIMVLMDQSSDSAHLPHYSLPTSSHSHQLHQSSRTSPSLSIQSMTSHVLNQNVPSSHHPVNTSQINLSKPLSSQNFHAPINSLLPTTSSHLQPITSSHLEPINAFHQQQIMVQQPENGASVASKGLDGSPDQGFAVNCSADMASMSSSTGNTDGNVLRRSAAPLNFSHSNLSYNQQQQQQILKLPEVSVSGGCIGDSNSVMMTTSIDGSTAGTSYIVAATDLHQLQQSGGQLLVQNSSASRQERTTAMRQLPLVSQQNQTAVLQSEAQQAHNNSTQQPLGATNSRFLSSMGQQMCNKRSQNLSSQLTSDKGRISAPGGAANEPAKTAPYDRPFKCDQCTASFIEQSECEEHRRKHSGDGPFTCEDCHFSFMYKSHYKSHKSRCEKKRATMTPQPGNLIKPPATPSIKREFPTHESLKGNLPNTRRRTARTLTDRYSRNNAVQSGANQQLAAREEDIKYNISQEAEELAADDPGMVARAAVGTAQPTTSHSVLKKPFIATKIKKESELNAFNPVKPSFKRLKHQHNAARPFECDLCDASFTTVEDLESHSQKHSSDGPYRCDSCQYLYLYRRLYDAHKRKCKKSRSRKDGPVGMPSQTTPRNQQQHNQQMQQQQQQQPSVTLHVDQSNQVQFLPHVLPQTQSALHLQNDQQQQHGQHLMLIEHPPTSTNKSLQARSLEIQTAPMSTNNHDNATNHQQQHLQPMEITGLGNGPTFLLGGQGAAGGLLDGQQLQLHTLHGTGVQVLELRGDELVAVTAGDGMRDGEGVKYEIVQTLDPSSVPHIMNLLKKGSLGPTIAQ
ncbi:zinc finger protein 236 isoform X1 [Hyalella azteca]|uniref:Zinc finger protein 236 isoform X1 n=2 Tax=Hyalella azteca TaxID=294128 RepID=A0A8B7NQK7_HYAAZ|nr:zinc finger protein 236 isoform X1 [Hyalella azteca]